MRKQPFDTPGEALTHHGVKGMKWGVRKAYATRNLKIAAEKRAHSDNLVAGTATPSMKFKHGFVNAKGIRKTADNLEAHALRVGSGKMTLADHIQFQNKLLASDITSAVKASRQKDSIANSEFQKTVRELTRTDRPQVLGTSGSKNDGDKQHGLTSTQKTLLTFGALTAAAAGYYAYSKYTGNSMPNISKILKEEHILNGMKLPANWDVRGLKEHPLSLQKIGDLAGGEIKAGFHDSENLVINASRGYADILPKEGFSNPFASEQHASVIRVLEQMRDKYPTIRNMNIEVVPLSKVKGLEGR